MSPPRFVCISCFRSASTTEAGEHCGAPRAALDDPSVVARLHEHAEAVLRRRKQREDLLIWSAAALSGVLVGLLLSLGMKQFDDIMTALAALVPVLGIFYGLLHARWFKGSARATLAARSGPADESPDAMLRDHVARTATTDPRTMPAPQLVAWLGGTID
jgi:hypothetical protein